MTFRWLDAFKRQFEHLQRFHRPHRPEALGGVGTDPAVEGADLIVIESGVGLGEGHQLSLAIPEAKAVVGVEVGALPAAGLGVEQHGIEPQRFEFVFPPVPALASHLIGRVERLEHQSFGPECAGPLAQGIELIPAGELEGGREPQAALTLVLLLSNPLPVQGFQARAAL